MPERTPLHEQTTQAGAQYAEVGDWLVPARYGEVRAEYEQARQGAVLFDLSHRGKLEVSGGDAATFLHNLCTNDVKGLPVGAGCEAFLTTPTARAVAYFQLYHLLLHDGRDAFWLDLEPGRVEKLIQALDRYVISEQVEFADRTREFAQLHLAGPPALEVLEKALVDDVPELGPLEHMVRTFGANAHSHIRRHDRLALTGYDVVCLRAVAPAVWSLLVRAGARPAGLEAYELLRVEAGTPVYGADVDENRFVVEVGRTAQAISYTKGCYLGQEPIVMARDRGQVNRMLMGVLCGAGPALAAGTKLYQGEAEVGSVTSSVASPRLGQTIALAYLRRGNQEPGMKLTVEPASSGRTAVVSALPFVAGQTSDV